MITAGRAPGGAVQGYDFAESNAEGAEAGHSQRAHGEIFVVGIELHLHRAGQLHLVLFFIGGDHALQLGLDIWQQQICFFFVKLDDRRIVFERFEILVAIEQAQAIYRSGVAISVVVGHLELLERFVCLPEAHQLDAQFRASRPQFGIGFNGLAVVGDAVLKAHVQRQMVRDDSVGFAVSRIHLPHFRKPRIWRAIRQHFDCGMDSRGIEGFGRNF